MRRFVTCQPRDKGYLLAFDAMASPCEVLIDHQDKQLASAIGQVVAKEAWRIEDKYSRYTPNSVCGQLNRDAGRTCSIDQETYLLLQFAQQCYEMSNGLFDITSGILRKAWLFDCSDKIPSQEQIDELLPLIGWNKLQFNESEFAMKSGMELDFGGIGKEYAVDKAMLLASEITPAPTLINFGGDIAVNGPRANNLPWVVGVEHPSLNAASLGKNKPVAVQISQGAIATSGDAKRYLQVGKKRYGHVLNVQTGWPIDNPPRSVTVAAPKCIQAGLLATLALLQGEQAEQFLIQSEIQHWLIT